MRKDVFDYFVHLVHLRRKDPETDFGIKLKLMSVDWCWPV